MSAGPGSAGGGTGNGNAGGGNGNVAGGSNGSNGSNGNGDGDDPAKNKRRRTIIIVAIVAVLVLIVAIVAAVLVVRHRQADSAQPGETVTAEQPKTKPKKQETKKAEPEPEPKRPAVTEVTMPKFECESSDSWSASTSRWGWNGSAMVSNMLTCGSDSSGEYSFGLWTPGMESAIQVDVSMLESGEKVYSEPKVASTYGDNPAVFVLYAVKTKAVGTTPETVHLFAHQVDTKTGELSDRIDLRTEADNLIDYEQDYSYEVLAASERTVAVGKTWHSRETIGSGDSAREADIDHMQVMGLTGGETTAKQLQTFQDGTTTSSSGYVYLSDVKVESAQASDVYYMYDGSYHLYSVDDNKAFMNLAGNFCDPDDKRRVCGISTIWHLGGSNFFISSGSSTLSDPSTGVLNAADGSFTGLISLLGLPDDDEYRYIASSDQFSDGTLFFQIKGNSSMSDRVMLLSPDLKCTEVLSGDQWARLLLNSGSINGINYLTDNIYVTTTDEQIMLDRQGQSVGQYSRRPDSAGNSYSYNSDGDGGDSDHTVLRWMRWTGDDGTVTVTVGQAPGDAAPSQDADDAGSGSGSDGSGSGESGSGESGSKDSSDGESADTSADDGE